MDSASAKRTFSSKKAKKGEIKEIVFDDNARREYLTGFRKRNLAKKEAKVNRAKERQKQELLDLRRTKRQELAERAAQNAHAVEQAYGATSSDDDSDFGAGPSSSRPAEPQELEFEDEEQLATVTVVEDFDVDILGDHKPSKPAALAGDDDEEPSASTSSRHPAPSSSKGPDGRIRKIPASAGAAPSSSSTYKLATKSASSTKKKRPSYLTKAERKTDKLKQKAKRTERMDEDRTKRKFGGSGTKRTVARGKKGSRGPGHLKKK